MKLRIRNGRATLRHAGIFEYPAEMFKEIQKWMLATYAGHVMALAELRLKRLVSYAEEVDKNIAAAEKWLKKLPAWLKKNVNKSNKSLKIYVGPPGQGEWYGIKTDDSIGEDRFLLGRGTNRITYDDPYLDAWSLDEVMQPITRQIKEAIERTRRKKFMVERTQKSRQDARTLPGQARKQDTELVTLHLVIKEAKKYTSKAKRYRSKATAKFPVNLEGWKYLSEYHKELQTKTKALLETVPEENKAVRNGLEEVIQPLKDAVAPGGYYMKLLNTVGWGRPPKITVTLYFDPHQNRGGQWSISDKQLEVDVMRTAPLQSVDNFKRGIDKINRTLEHELQHVGQDVLRQIKELKEDAGLPSRKVRELGIHPSGHPYEELAVSKEKKQEAVASLKKLMDAARKLQEGKQTRKFQFYHRTGAPVKLYIKKNRRYLIYEDNGSYAGDYNTLEDVRKFINEYYVKPLSEEKESRPKVMWHKPRVEHPLRDVEFHTDLGNVVDNFMSQVPGVAKKDWRPFFHAFTGAKKDSRWNTNWYFKSWLKNKAKWRNAVREFAKAVSLRGFDAPTM